MEGLRQDFQGLRFDTRTIIETTFPSWLSRRNIELEANTGFNSQYILDGWIGFLQQSVDLGLKSVIPSNVKFKASSTVVVQRCVWMDEWMNGWMDGWMGGWMDGWMDGWIDGLINGLMDGCIDGWMIP